MTDQDKLLRAYARLTALRDALPNGTFVSERFVTEYHQALDHLGVLGVDVAEFRLLDGDITPRIASSNYLTGETRYTRERFVARALLLAKLTAVLSYFGMQIGHQDRPMGFRAPSSS